MLVDMILLAVLLIGSSFGQHCDPKTSPFDYYPHAITNVTVTGTTPMRVRFNIKTDASVTKDPVSVEGPVCASQFTAQAALTACRSMGCSKAAWTTAYISGQKSKCNYECDGLTASRDCYWVIGGLECDTDTMNLIECLKRPLFDTNCVSNGSNGYHINLVCTGC